MAPSAHFQDFVDFTDCCDFGGVSATKLESHFDGKIELIYNFGSVDF